MVGTTSVQGTPVPGQEQERLQQRGPSSGSRSAISAVEDEKGSVEAGRSEVRKDQDRGIRARDTVRVGRKL